MGAYDISQSVRSIASTDHLITYLSITLIAGVEYWMNTEYLRGAKRALRPYSLIGSQVRKMEAYVPVYPRMLSIHK